MGYIILLLIIATIGFAILTYNRLIAQIEAVRNNSKQIDIHSTVVSRYLNPSLM